MFELFKNDFHPLNQLATLFQVLSSSWSLQVLCWASPRLRFRRPRAGSAAVVWVGWPATGVAALTAAAAAATVIMTTRPSTTFSRTGSRRRTSRATKRTTPSSGKTWSTPSNLGKSESWPSTGQQTSFWLCTRQNNLNPAREYPWRLVTYYPL